MQTSNKAMPESATPEMKQAAWDALQRRAGNRGISHLYNDVHMETIYQAMRTAAPELQVLPTDRKGPNAE